MRRRGVSRLGVDDRAAAPQPLPPAPLAPCLRGALWDGLLGRPAPEYELRELAQRPAPIKHRDHVDQGAEWVLMASNHGSIHVAHVGIEKGLCLLCQALLQFRGAFMGGFAQRERL